MLGLGSGVFEEAVLAEEIPRRSPRPEFLAI